jgi:hypothetical protein
MLTGFLTVGLMRIVINTPKVGEYQRFNPPSPKSELEIYISILKEIVDEEELQKIKILYLQ